jgi:alpha-tubulin suppressor-like RCC1 family protein
VYEWGFNAEGEE